VKITFPLDTQLSLWMLVLAHLVAPDCDAPLSIV
jgi:hypothetical protein